MLLAFQAAPADAQTITLPAVMSRLQPLRDARLQPFWVNQADCLADDELTFPVTLTGYQSLRLEVWAGTEDCTQLNQREEGGASGCWLVYANSFTTNRPRITIRARDIVGRTPVDSNTGEPRRATADVCSLVSPPVQLGLYFLFVGATRNIVGTPAVWTSMGYDVTPPSPPTDPVVRAGNPLTLSWQPPPDTDVDSYRVSCIGVPEDPDAACPGFSVWLSDPNYECNSVPATSLTATVPDPDSTAFVPTYGVAAMDGVGNVSLLSRMVCAPENGGIGPSRDGTDAAPGKSLDTGNDGGGAPGDGGGPEELRIDSKGCGVARTSRGGSRWPLWSVLAAFAVVARRRRLRAERT